MRSHLNIGYLIFFLGLITHPARAQWGGYHFQRQLIGIEDSWQTIELPNELFYRIRPNYADLRIMGINATGDTLEAPYVLELPEAHPPVEKMAFSILNRSRRDGKFFATLESTTAPKINRIQLKIDNKNFDWRVQLEGSNNQKKWFTLVENYRILSIDNDISTYAFTTLHFPEAQYRYYRIAIPTGEEVGLSAATSSRQSEQKTAYRSYSIAAQSVQQNPAEQRTEIDLQLQWPVPVAYLSLDVTDTFDYYRPITIQLLTDSVKTEAGWQYQYSEVQSDILSSLEDREFTFPPTRSRAMRIFIYNQDNAPLHLGELQVKGQVPVLKVRFTEKADYSLRYGWADARPPRYDLANFTNKIPEALRPVQLGPEIRLLSDTEPSGPIFANQAWLWGIMILVIGLLGWFSVRMLGDEKSK